jgi:hypothetical protein
MITMLKLAETLDAVVALARTSRSVFSGKLSG